MNEFSKGKEPSVMKCKLKSVKEQQEIKADKPMNKIKEIKPEKYRYKTKQDCVNKIRY